VAVATGLLLLATPASALTRHALTASIPGPATAPLTNPTALAVDNSSGESRGDLYIANPPANARQTITVDATGGTYTLTFEGDTTSAIDHKAEGPRGPTGGTVAEHLEALPTVGLGNVSVNGPPGGPYTVEFTAALGGAEQPLLTANPSGLTGATHSVHIALARPALAVAQVEKFTPTGEFLYMLGSEVNKNGSDLCTKSEAAECQPGALGTSPGAFTAPTFLAVDPTSGDLYVADTGDNKVSKFDSSGNLIASWGTAGQLTGFSALEGVAADPSGDLFVLDGSTVHVYGSAGEPIRKFGVPPKSSPPFGLAVDAEDHLYDGRAKFSGAFGEILGTWDQGVEATGFAVAPSTGDLYAIEDGEFVDQFAANCPEQTAKESCPPLESFGAKALSEAQGIAVDSGGTVYVADAGHSRVAVFNPVLVPELSTASKATGQSSVELTGKVDPAGGIEVTECQFEYNHDIDQTWTVTVGATATGDLTSGSKEITGLTSQVGTFIEGEAIEAPGIPAHTTVTSVAAGQIEISKAAEATASAVALTARPTGGTFTLNLRQVTTSPLVPTTTSAELQSALESLHNIGQENVKVSGPRGGPYTVRFTGSLADEEIEAVALPANASNLVPSGATVEVETTTVGVPGGSPPIAVPCLNASGETAAPFAGEEEVHAELTGLTPLRTYHFRLVAANAKAADVGPYRTIFIPHPPEVGAESVSEVDPDAVAVHAQIEPGGGDTHYHVEYLTSEQLEANLNEGKEEFAGALQSPSLDAGSAETPQSLTAHLGGLEQATTYHYRVVAENFLKTATGAARTFTTLAFASPTDPCPNAHVRQQTSSAGLLDCRAYELVSAANSGGYDVESSLIEGQTPFAGYPEAEDRVLYGVHGGGIPGTNHPTDRGLDPYLATRTNEGWTTEYVGIPSNATPSTSPFASPLQGADAGLDTLAFGGSELCSPCFPDGSTGQPLRLPNRELTQGMSGPLDPGPTAEPAGYIAKPLSADGTHLLFGSTSQFAPGGNSGQISIYDRNLKTEETHVVSDESAGNPILCTLHCSTDGIGELDISKDGSHILIGQLVEEKAGARYWHLYMNVGDSNKTIDLTPATTHGVLYDGMTEDGSKVFFSSVDHLTGHDTSHSGADIYVAELSGEAATLHLISRGPEEDVPGSPGDTAACDPVSNSAHLHWNATGATEENCGVVAVGGGGGVASKDGTIYFLSPEKLSGSAHGVQNAPNLYLARPGDGYTPHFLATLESTLNAPLPPRSVHAFSRSFGSFEKPTAAAIAEAQGEEGDSYVLDTSRTFGGSVEKFDPSGNPIASFGKNGRIEGQSARGNGTLQKGSATIELVTTTAGAFAVGQEIFANGIPEGSTITKVEAGSPASQLEISQPATTSGSASLKAKRSFQEYGYAGLSTTIAVDNTCSVQHLSGSACTTLDPSNRDLYVPDALNSVVDKFGPSGEFASQIQISGGFLTGAAVDQTNGNVYVSQAFGEVQVYDPEGNLITGFQPTATPDPTGIAVDRNGTVYIVNGGGLFGTVGTAAAYQPSSTSPLEYESLGHEFDPNPSFGVAVGPEGSVYVDEGTQVSQFDSSGHQLGSPIGKGLLKEHPVLQGGTASIGLGAGSDRVIISNPGAGPGENGNVVVFSSSYPSTPQIDNPLVVDSVSSPEARHTADFQITPSGNDAVFPSTLALAGNGEETAGHSEVYRYDATTEKLTCISCTTTGAPSAGESSLASNGPSLTDDGNRVFFNTTDALVGADTDKRQDVYEWELKGSGNCEETSPTFHKSTGTCLALISAGTSTFDSGLLGVDANGKDAYFFTRDSLAPQDENGPTVKVYDAREGGGFPYTYPPASCKASDECHGASSPAPPPLEVRSESNTSHQAEPEPKECKKGLVLKHGKCVKKPKHHHKHHRRGGASKRSKFGSSAPRAKTKHLWRANHKRGGKK